MKFSWLFILALASSRRPSTMLLYWSLTLLSRRALSISRLALGSALVPTLAETVEKLTDLDCSCIKFRSRESALAAFAFRLRLGGSCWHNFEFIILDFKF